MRASMKIISPAVLIQLIKVTSRARPIINAFSTLEFGSELSYLMISKSGLTCLSFTLTLQFLTVKQALLERTSDTGRAVDRCGRLYHKQSSGQHIALFATA